MLAYIREAKAKLSNERQADPSGDYAEYPPFDREKQRAKRGGRPARGEATAPHPRHAAAAAAAASRAEAAEAAAAMGELDKLQRQLDAARETAERERERTAVLEGELAAARKAQTDEADGRAAELRLKLEAMTQEMARMRAAHAAAEAAWQAEKGVDDENDAYDFAD